MVSKKAKHITEKTFTQYKALLDTGISAAALAKVLGVVSKSTLSLIKRSQTFTEYLEIRQAYHTSKPKPETMKQVVWQTTITNREVMEKLVSIEAKLDVLLDRPIE